MDIERKSEKEKKYNQGEKDRRGKESQTKKVYRRSRSRSKERSTYSHFGHSKYYSQEEEEKRKERERRFGKVSPVDDSPKRHNKKERRHHDRKRKSYSSSSSSSRSRSSSSDYYRKKERSYRSSKKHYESRDRSNSYDKHYYHEYKKSSYHASRRKKSSRSRSKSREKGTNYHKRDYDKYNNNNNRNYYQGNQHNSNFSKTYNNPRGFNNRNASPPSRDPSPPEVIANPELLEYPFCKFHMKDYHIEKAFQRIQKYKLNIVRGYPFIIKNIPELTDEEKRYKKEFSVIEVIANDYWKMSFLSDYFNEHVRVKCRRYDADESPYEFWTKNRLIIIEEMKAKNLLLTIKEINEFLYTKNIGCNTFKPQLLVGMAREFHATQVLDFSAGWGDRLIGALAAGISYTGVDPNDELFPGYKQILQRFGNGEFVSEQGDLIYKNKWNTYKMLCSPFQTADLKTDTFDFVFTSPPYFDLEIYSNHPTQSIQEFPQLSDWETGFLYVSLQKAWDRLRPNGHLVLILNNVRGGQDFTLKAVKWACQNLPNNEYLGLLPYAHRKWTQEWRSPQPMWIWRKKVDENIPLTDLYYIGNEKCEKICCNDIKELEEVIGEKVQKIEDGFIYLGTEDMNSQAWLEYGTVTVGNSRYRVRKYIKNLSLDQLNPQVKIEKITLDNGSNLTLICDHLLSGGTKQRAVDFSSINAEEVVYAGPYNGYAQVAMAIGAKLYNKRATVFLSKNDYYTTLRAMQYGCQVKLLPGASLKEMQAAASKYAQENGCHLAEFGFDTKEFKELLFKNLTTALQGVLPTNEITNRIWVVAGSATLLNVLYKLFPKAKFGVVQVGKKIWPDQIEPDRTELYIAEDEFYESARMPPPYRSALKYDAKAWQFIKKHAKDGDLIWNVAS